MLGPGLVVGGTAELDDLEAVAALQHPVADLGRLQHAVAGLHEQRFALVLVDDPHPPLVAVDHLEPHLVVVHVVGHGTGRRDADVGADEPSALTAGDDVAVLHARPARPPGLAVASVGDDELGLLGRQHHPWVGLHQLDPGAVGRHQLPVATRHGGRIVAPQPEPEVGARLLTVELAAWLEAQPESVTRELRDHGRIGREDRVDPEPETPGEEVERRLQRIARHHHDGAADTGAGTVGFVRSGHRGRR